MKLTPSCDCGQKRDARRQRREEALRLISQWLAPHPIDGTIALYRPLPARDAAEWTPVLQTHIQRLLKMADASIAGTLDTLRGLKENVIMGRLIPAGTGFTLPKEALAERG